jgi:hypothetical protein
MILSASSAARSSSMSAVILGKWKWKRTSSILDTTFKVIRQYHTATLLAIIHTVGLPLGFSFGHQESIDLYDHFYTTFRDELGINLTRCVLLSDQGAALKVIERRHPLHLFCLGHSLQALNKYKHGQAIGNIVKARGRKEFEVLC